MGQGRSRRKWLIRAHPPEAGASCRVEADRARTGRAARSCRQDPGRLQVGAQSSESMSPLERAPAPASPGANRRTRRQNVKCMGSDGGGIVGRGAPASSPAGRLLTPLFSGSSASPPSLMLAVSSPGRATTPVQAAPASSIPTSRSAAAAGSSAGGLQTTAGLRAAAWAAQRSAIHARNVLPVVSGDVGRSIQSEMVTGGRGGAAGARSAAGQAAWRTVGLEKIQASM
jgi:hypothetical protein